MKLILRYMNKKDRIVSAVIVIFVVVQVVLETKIPVIMGEISGLLQQGSMTAGAVRTKGIEMVVYALTAFAAASIVCYLIIDVTSRVSNSMRISVFGKLLDFSLFEVSSFGTGTLISRCNDDIYSVQSFMTQSLQSLIRAPVLLIIVFFRLSATEGLWVAMSAGAVALMAVLVLLLFIRIAPLVRKQSIARDRMIGASHEHIYGIRHIHCGNRFSSQEENYDRVNGEVIRYGIKSKTIMSFFSPTTAMLIYTLTLAIYISGAFLMQNQGMTEQTAAFSSMISFVSYIAFLFTALVSIVLVLLNVPQFINSQSRIFEILNQENSIPDGNFSGPVPEHGTVEFRHVSFSYPEAKASAVSDITFRVKTGQTAAIIGGTGAGKTTVLNLILRLYEANEGEILVDGVKVKDYRLRSLRDLIGYVPQENYLFSGTIAENIGYGENGRFKATLEEIRKAAVTGQADTFIRQKEEGYYAGVHAGGTNFSGGQRQRLTISRAICRDPEIYIFDDSFSALDFETDAKLRRALKKTTEGATVIIVAQRISSVRDADSILVMDKGRIVDQGTHEELLKRCSVYQEIAASQNPEEKAV